VSVVRNDDVAGEEGYEVVCAADEAADVWDTLLNHGNNAAPFGYGTWETLTLEAGTPLFHDELAGRVPNVAGLRNAVDYKKGCFVGQETVARVENVGRASRSTTATRTTRSRRRTRTFGWTATRSAR
jgi:aminomethyltransferase